MDSASGSVNSQTRQDAQSNPTSNPAKEPRIYAGSVQPKGFPGLPSGWSSEWETFPSSDSRLQLYGASHLAPGYKSQKQKGRKPRVLIVFHGFAEHGGRYLHLPHFLGDTFDLVYCLDHRGHGRSEGPRGHAEHFDLLAQDAALAIRRVQESTEKKLGSSVEIHLLGHSMGGLITLRTLSKFAPAGVQTASVSAPLLRLATHVPRLKKWAGRVLSHVWSSVQMASEVDPQVLSHDPDVVEAYQSDRLVHRKITPALYFSMEEVMNELLRSESSVSCPVQFLIPMADQLVHSETTLKFYSQIRWRDKGLKTYPGFYHEILNEIGKEQVFGDLISWVGYHSS